MGIPVKPDAAQMVQVVELLFHVTEGALRRIMLDAAEEFSDEECPAALFLIEIDTLGKWHLIETEAGRVFMDAQLRKDVTDQISVKGVVSGKMAEVSHEIRFGFLKIPACTQSDKNR